MLDTIRSSRETFKLCDVYNACGNDMLKRMQIVFPILTKMQMDILGKYGYSRDSDGLLKFFQEITVLEKDDDIKKLNEELRSLLIPTLPDI
uniref:Protein C10 n=1 Tax=Romanomermis culicivorax TaxID=13658 RepID=A0A915LAC3_ROMCU